MHVANNGGCDNGYARARWNSISAVRYVTAARALVEQAALDWVRELSSDLERQTAIEVQQSAAHVAAVDHACAIERKITAVDIRLATLTTRREPARNRVAIEPPDRMPLCPP